MNKKVLHIVDSLSLGGAQTVLKGFFEDQKDNENIFLFSLRNKNTKIEIKHKNVVRFSSNKKYSFVPLIELRRLIKEEKIEIIHTHLFRSHVFGWILKKMFFPKIKFVLHEHGQIFRNNRYYDILVRFFSTKVDLALTVSNATREVFLSKTKIPGSKVHVLYNFVDLKRFKFRIPKRDSEFRIGFVGRLDVVKRVDFLIKSFKGLLESNNEFNAKLVVVGAGPEEDNLKKIARDLNIEEQVLFAGKQEKVEEFLCLFDVFILPSKSEACPMSLLEAFAMKIPAVVSNIVQLEEFSRSPSKALMFKENDKNDLVKQIMKVANKERDVEMNIENAYKLSQNSSIENYSTKLLKMYQEV